MTKKPDFEISVDRRMLTDRLRQVAVGESITYKALSEVISRDVQGPAHGALAGARETLLKNDGIVFGTIRGEGLKRLDDSEIVKTGESAIRRVRRASRRAAQIIAIADYTKLPQEAKVQHNTHLSVLGMLATVTKSTAIKKIEGKVSQAQTALPLAATLEAFKG